MPFAGCDNCHRHLALIASIYALGLIACAARLKEMVMSSITVDAGNDVPPSIRATSVGVSGEGFAPATAVNIGVFVGPNHVVAHTRTVVEADGTFDWAALVRPKLGCATPVRAVVHDASGEEFSATAEVFCP